MFAFSYKSANKRSRRYCRVLGVPDRGFHCLRHTKATNMLARGVPTQAVAALLGHSEETLLHTYNHTNALSFAHYLD